jgi:quinolinate synthase
MLWQPSLPEKYHQLTPGELSQAIEARRRELGGRLVILGHHYQTDEVIAHADFTGDSLKLSQLAAQVASSGEVEFVIFCGVHFMAETADMLTPDHVSVILPDLSAGCSMADMAAYDDTVEAWKSLHACLASQGWKGKIIPITYVNSTAAIKAFVGEHGGACCTSSNAAAVFRWAMSQGQGGEDVRILFLPDQHLGRNTAAAYGIDIASATCVYDPVLARKGRELGGATPEQVLASRVILWAGHCSVHKLFRPEHCASVRRLDAAEGTDTRILVHPECAKEVVDLADMTGSTEFIIQTVDAAPTGSRWAIGTEVHLVNRIAQRARERGVSVRILSECQCLCTTMYRIDQPHLLWVLDALCAPGRKRVPNQVSVLPAVREKALLALDRMLALSAKAKVAAE